jgi:hypothetical protein
MPLALSGLRSEGEVESSPAVFWRIEVAKLYYSKAIVVGREKQTCTWEVLRDHGNGERRTIRTR